MKNPYSVLLEKIHHNVNPYQGYPCAGWGGVWYNDPGAAREIFKTAIGMSNPGLIVEVGSFVGESSIFMAKHIKALKLDAAILCVDTWMGGIDHWKNAPEKLVFHFGRPALYYRFMANVISHECADVILPLSLDSLNASRLLKLLDLGRVDLVYVDGSHEEGDVLRDYMAYWELLRPGGVLLVDDLTNWFPGVLHDWNTFLHIKNLRPQITEGEKAILVKP